MMYSRFAAVRPQFISPPPSLRWSTAVALAALGACLLVAGCGGGSGSDPVRVTVSPSTATVATGGTQTFTASVYNRGQDVTWSVEEGSTGGTITSAGVYTAPTTPGTYHVIATSVADNSVSGTATVTVEGGSSTVTVS